jgi:hypothetical protein
VYWNIAIFITYFFLNWNLIRFLIFLKLQILKRNQIVLHIFYFKIYNLIFFINTRFSFHFFILLFLIVFFYTLYLFLKLTLTKLILLIIINLIIIFFTIIIIFFLFTKSNIIFIFLIILTFIHILKILNCFCRKSLHIDNFFI